MALALVQDAKIISLRRFADPNGSLVPIEGSRDIPFSIARIFYIFGTGAGDVRGEHAHRKCQQLLICLRGKCEVQVTDGAASRTFLLESPSDALLVPASIWAVQKYLSSETILLVLTDQPFVESDYIRSHDEFMKFRAQPGASQ